MKKDYIDYCWDPLRRLTVKLRKKSLFLLFIFFGVLSAHSQSVTVSGAVTGDGNYGTLGEAFTAIGTSQAGANINITLTNNITEPVPASLGAGDWQSLTIKPSGGVWTVSGSMASEMILLNGADNVTINGLNTGGNGLVFSNTSTATSAATIKFVNDATNNTITNCSLQGSGTGTVSAAGGVVYFASGTTTGNDNNTISNCDIGPAGSNLPVKLIYSAGTNTTEATCNSEITITNCNLYDFFIASNYSAALYAALGNTAWNITNNKIYQTATRTFTAGFNMIGIYFSNSTYGNNVKIENNVIGYANSAGTGTLTIDKGTGTIHCGFQGIYLLTSKDATLPSNINDNTIANISLTSDNGTLYGVFNAASISPANNTINIRRNTIRNLATITFTGDIYGIDAGVAGVLNCSNNVIENITRNTAGHTYAIKYGSPTTATFDGNTINSISSTNTTGTAKNFFGFYTASAVPTEIFTNNTLSNFSSALTTAQTIVGINNGTSNAGDKTFRNNVMNNFSVTANGGGTLIGIKMNTGGALNEISGNTVHTFTGGTSGIGVSVASGTTNNVFGNTIHTLSAVTVNGMAISAGTTNNIFKNKIYGLTSPSATAAIVYGMAFTGGGTQNLYNNIIGDLTAPTANLAGTPNQLVGVNATGGVTGGVNLYNNTIVLNGTSTGANFGSSAVSVGPPVLTLRNNILVNTSVANGTGLSVVLRKALGTYDNSSNNNLFYGTAIFTDGTNTDQTIGAFKTRLANSRDNLSVNENPNFLSTVGSSADYLHINSTIPTQIESAGANIALVTEDFDGNARNATTPDMGADEFTGTAIDLLGPAITHTPDVTCIAGSRTISATFTDASGVPTTGAGLPVAYWRINNGAYTAAVGTPMGSGVYEFTIGTGSVTGDAVYYYFVAQDVAATPNVSVYPALGAAGFSVNPPAVSTLPTTPITLLTPLAGTYTVGTTGNYATLTAAVADYNVRCLAGPVTFSLLDATYPSETFPITIQQNADASATNTLTVSPASGVSVAISGNNATGLLKLNGADYVTINGLNTGGSALTISNASTNATAGTSTIEFRNDASNNIITNCTLSGSATVPNGTDGGVVYFATGTTTGNDSNTISYCNIGPAGANLPSKLIYANGSTTSAAICNSGITITNCNMYDYFLTSGCAAVYALAGNTDWTITNNKMYQTATRTFTAAGIMYGVHFSSATYGTNVQITGNTIGYADNAGNGTLTVLGSGVVGQFQGIYFSGQAAGTVNNLNNNIISNISLASSSGPFYGIYNGITASSGATMNFNGNTVRNIATTTTGAVISIYAGGGTTVNCSNNTINAISRTGTGGTGVLHGINYAAPASITLNGNTVTNLSSANTTSTGLISGIQSGTAPIDIITNNTVSGLSSTSTSNQLVYGISVSGGAGNKTIQNNTVTGISVPATATGTVYGIRMAAGGTLNTISGNTVSSILGPNSVIGNGIHGIFMNAGTTNNVYKNKVYGLTGQGALSGVIGLSIQGGTTYNVYNNIIGDLTSPIASDAGGEPHLVIGINTWGNAMNMYNNTVVLNGSNSGTNFGSSAVSTSGPLTLRNNILINNLPARGTGVSVVLRLASATAVANYGATSDNNLLRGTAIHTRTGLTDFDATLAAFKTRTGNRDLLSINEDPTFVSTLGSDPTYLHINTTVPTQIESGGANIASVIDDFDGDARNASTPDIGADEFAGIAIDLMGPVIAHTPDTACAAGARTISATITDATGVPTTGTGLPVAYWRINSEAYTAAVGTSMGAGVYNFTIGTGSVAGDAVSYYFVAQDMVATPNMSVYPSVGAAGFSANPPAVATPTTAPLKLVTPMAGTYTVGTTGNYVTLTAAVADYNARCLGGAVTFSLIDAAYPSETYPITIQQNADASVVNTLTIKPASGKTPTISGNNASAILKLNGADYVTVDGSNNGTTSRDLTIVNTNNASNAVIWLASTTLAGATNNTIKNTVVTGQGITGTRSAIISCGSTITYAEKANNGNTYRNNVISLAKNGIEILGSGAADLQTGTLITQNAIGTTTNALGVTGVTVASESNGVVSNNTIQKVSAGTITPFTYAGGVMLNNTTGVTVSNNAISDIKATAALTAVNSIAGIVMTPAGNTNAVITGNTITGVANTSTAANGARGITILGDGTVASNNMISDIYNYQGSGLGGASTIGISIGNATALGANVSLYNNTIHLYGPHPGNSANTTSGVATCIYIATSGTGLNIRNNILVNSYENSTSTGDKSYAIYTTAADNTQFAAIDNNDYVSGNATLANTLGYLGADKITLAEMITAFGGNVNSKKITPVFVSATDLHMASAGNAYLDNLGTTIAGVTTDIDGDVRTATPDMGADEFTAPACTAAVGGSTTPSVASICDSGSVTVVATGYSIGETTTYQWQSSVDSGFTTPVNIGAATAVYADLTTTVSATTYYRLAVTCGVNGLTNYSTVSAVTVTSTVTPTFTQVAAICSGATLSALPTTSDNGVAGTWSPALNNTATTTYTFTPNSGQCATTATMTITVNPVLTPAFTPVDPICSGTALSALPTTSTNGVVGAWSPALNNMATTTYTFTPNAGQCALTATMTITVSSSVTPTFTQVAAICSGTTLSALPTTSNNGIAGTWSPALNNTATTTYTFTPDAGSCGTTTTMTITVNPILTPTFTPVAAICSGATLSALPTTSTNGIAGTWSPALNNTATTTYTFTPNAGQCGTTTTMTITVNPNVTPTFTPVAAICSGATLSALPTTSTNGISGTWSPALNNTATTTYTFTPNAGQCGTTTTMTITVNPNVTPTFTPVAAICSGATLSALPTTSTNGISGTWSPALNNTTTTTYTFTPNAGQCGTTTTMTITVNPNVTPTFTPVAAICSGATLSALPTTSTNGIVGTWSPALNNTATTTYTFTPNAGQCGTTATMTITVNPSIMPTFTQVAAICSGTTLSALPTTSDNGIAGTWSPALNNTATTTYTFTPNAGQCAATTTMTITVNSTPAPTGPSNQNMGNGQTMSNIAVNGSGIVWYASAADAANGVNPIAAAATVNNGTYYATQTVGGCTSTTTLAVTVTVVLGNEEFSLNTLKVYPNPVSTALSIENSVEISGVEIYTIAGQRVLVKAVNALSTLVDMSDLAAGTYFVRISSENAVKTVNVIKK